MEIVGNDHMHLGLTEMWVAEVGCQTASLETRKLGVARVDVEIPRDEDSTDGQERAVSRPWSLQSGPGHRATGAGV